LGKETDEVDAGREGGCGWRRDEGRSGAACFGRRGSVEVDAEVDFLLLEKKGEVEGRGGGSVAAEG